MSAAGSRVSALPDRVAFASQIVHIYQRDLLPGDDTGPGYTLVGAAQVRAESDWGRRFQDNGDIR